MTMRTDLAIAATLSAARPRPSARMAPAEGRAEAGAPAASDAARPRAEERSRWLYGPVVDFLLLGGGSFVVLAAMAAFFPRDEASRVALAGAMLFLAHFVNHPHFAHSYQIFYRGFGRKAFGPCCHDDLARAEDKAPLPSGREAPLPPGEGFGVREERGFTHGSASGLASETTGTRLGEA